MDKAKAQKMIDKFKKIQSIRERALKVLLRIEQKTSQYKLEKLKQKLGELTK